MGIEHGHRIDEAASAVPRDGSNGFWACICGWIGSNFTAHASGRKEAGSEDMREGTPAQKAGYVPPSGCYFNPFAESPACVCHLGWGHNATEYEKYKTAQDPASEYLQLSTLDLALALQRGPEDGFYRFSKPLYRKGTMQQCGQQVIWMSGDSKRIENAYAERIKLIAAEEETRMSLSNVGTDRLKKAINDGLAAGHYHCFVVKNFGHQEVVTATYVEICDELNHRERQGTLDALRELPLETLDKIIDKITSQHLEAVTFNQEDGEPVTWTRADLIHEIQRQDIQRLRKPYISNLL